MPAYNVLIMGASYGSLLATKLLFGGHKITMVCLPAEVEAFNSEGAIVRLPVRGRKEPVELSSKKLPGSLRAAGPGDVNPADFDLVALAMQEPQYRSPGVRELLDAVATSRVPSMSIMNMPPLPYLKRIPGLDTDALKAAFTDARVWDNFEPGRLTLCSPDPQAIRPPGEKINVLQVTLPTNFKVARFDSDESTNMLRQMEARHRGGALQSRRRRDRAAGQAQGAQLDLRAAREMGDAAVRQLSLRHQGRRGRHQGRGAPRHRGIALGLQLGRRACARSSAPRPTTSCRSRNTPRRQTIWCGRPRPRGR